MSADQTTQERATWCPDAARYDRGECGWPQCQCPDNGPTAHDLRAVRARLCNTLATGEANEAVCYAEIEKLTARIAAMESNHGQRSVPSNDRANLPT